jgi:hypothetical protein
MLTAGHRRVNIPDLNIFVRADFITAPASRQYRYET